MLDCLPCVPKRYVTILLTCCGMLVSHAMRVNIAVTVVTILDKSPHEKLGSLEAIAHLPDVSWDSKMVGFLHSAFFIGYVITQLPGGFLANRFPAHWLFGGCIFLSSCLNLLLPLCIGYLGYPYTWSVRFLQGVVEGVLFPSSYAVMRHWTTPDERGRCGSAVLTGVYAGAVVGLPLSGWITHYYGWQYTYYAAGGLCLVWSLIWTLMVYEKPACHPHITDQELKYIEDKQGETAIVYENDTVPWKGILTSLPVNSLNICHFARSWIFFLLVTNEPTYLNVFGYDIKENGLLSALPHMLMATTSGISGYVADGIVNYTSVSTTQVRKLFTGVGFGVQSVCCFVLFFAFDGTTALVFLTIGVGMSGFAISGWQINHLDLAPRYAHILVAITTTWGTSAGILSPLITGEMTVEQTITAWQYVFLTAGCILAVAVSFYSIFGSAEKQIWAEPSTKLQLIQKSDPLVKKPYGTIYDHVQPVLSQVPFNDSKRERYCLLSKEKDNADNETPLFASTNN